jgi:CheY-like chemotaxis protein
MSTILLADDNFGDTEALRLLLEFEGYRVVTTANGYAALRAAQRERPDLVITDWEMPLMDGIELCRQLKRCAELSGIRARAFHSGPRSSASLHRCAA